MSNTSLNSAFTPCYCVTKKVSLISQELNQRRSFENCKLVAKRQSRQLFSSIFCLRSEADPPSDNGPLFIEEIVSPESETFENTSSSSSKPTSLASDKKRTGLYRIPVSGSVQSATSSHGLPTPAIAVRNLIEQARFAHLCTIMSRMHHRRKGYPFGSLVEFAIDETGHPIFLLSPLAIHTRNLLADPRCTLVVQIPGGSGLANARVTFFGDVFPLPPESQEWAQNLYTSKHHHGSSQKWGNFYLYRMDAISDIYFVGGFGTVAWVDVKEYISAKPDLIAAQDAEGTLQELNGRFSKQLTKLLAASSELVGGKCPVDDAALISIDGKGVDVRVRNGAQFNVQRLSFKSGQLVQSLDEAAEALQDLIDHGSDIPRQDFTAVCRHQ